MAYNLEQLSVKLARENAASDVKIWGGHHMGAGAQVSAAGPPSPCIGAMSLLWASS